MAFSSAIQLMAFASVTQASAGAEGPANALFDKPTASATAPQRRILYGENDSYYYDEVQGHNEDQCHYPHTSYGCPVGFMCEAVDIVLERKKFGGWRSDYRALRCDGVPGISGFLENYNWAFPILGTFAMSTVSLLGAFLSGLPSRWTRGDYSTLSAILLQLGGTAMGIINVKARGRYHDLREAAIPFLVSYPLLFFGIKSASRQRVMKMKATKFMIGMAFFTLIPGFCFGYLANARIEVFPRMLHFPKRELPTFY